MPADLIIYALIAAGLVFWLRSILGSRNGDEGSRPNPYLSDPLSGEPQMSLGADARGSAGESSIAELAQNPKGNMAIAARSAELGLVEIARYDRGFDVITFLRAAQDAFVFVVESFADGDRETLKELLGPQVYAAFDQAITERENAGDVMKTEIRGIKSSEIVEARLTGASAFITVRFVAEETTFTKNQTGEIIFGHPEKTTQMRDVWTFTRDLRGRDPRWLVVETREDGASDNLTIPNTH